MTATLNRLRFRAPWPGVTAAGGQSTTLRTTNGNDTPGIARAVRPLGDPFRRRRDARNRKRLTTIGARQ